MFNKIYEWFYEVKTKTVPMSYVIEKDGSYSSESNNGKWCFYWIGDFKTGKEVKVAKAEHLEAVISRLKLKIYDLEDEIRELKGEE